MTMNAPGYEKLADVLQRAYDQAATGKGHERHAQGEPFHEQVMQDGARRFGVGGLLFQAFKKSEESQRLPHDRAVAELLGAINYLAGAVIAMDREVMPRQKAFDESLRAEDVHWHRWHGCGYPFEDKFGIKSGINVKVKCRDKSIKEGCATGFAWSHVGKGFDILYYSVIGNE